MCHLHGLGSEAGPSMPRFRFRLLCREVSEPDSGLLHLRFYRKESGRCDFRKPSASSSVWPSHIPMAKVCRGWFILARRSVEKVGMNGLECYGKIRAELKSHVEDCSGTCHISLGELPKALFPVKVTVKPRRNFHSLFQGFAEMECVECL